MIFFAYIFWIYLGVYVFIILRVIFTLNRELKATQKIAGENSISVLIPFRNEAKNIKACVESVINQKIDSKFEIILINDHSGDDFLDQIPKSEFVKVVDLNDEEKGKKRALSKGVEIASGDIVATTDADCIVAENWLSEISNRFQTKSIQMSLGKVFVKENRTALSSLQSSESLILGLFTEYGVKINRPILASGANLAFRKSAFIKVGGYEGNEHIPSGDDMFLLEKMKHYFGVKSISCHNAEVLTKSEKTFKAFLTQRARWFNKMKYIKSLQTNRFNYFISGMNVLTLLYLLNYGISFQVMMFFTLKFMVDLMLLSRAQKVNVNHLSFAPIFFLWNLIYPIVIIFSTLVLKPKWKRRNLD